jgi:UDP-glucose:(heptosyl)LPS alpha-1,3-glucosyltransferase
MNLAFVLYKYFPYGGLQRDFLRIARTCLERGHSIHVYTMRWDGPVLPNIHIHFIKAKGMQNHTRRYSFAQQLKLLLEQNNYDLVVGFNKMPNLDVYYAADTCYQAKARKQRGLLYRLSSRYRYSVADEAAVFGKDSNTQILLISALQQQEFQTYYQTPNERFHLLPPGIDKDRKAPANAQEIRTKLRQEAGLATNDLLLLMVGSGFKTKGLDRTLRACAALPHDLKQRVRIFVIGKDHAEIFQRQAVRLKIDDRLKFLGGRDDVPNFLLAADLLLHPAYNENTGTVLLEALVAGLPVLTTDVCGYAHYIEQAQAGKVLPSPFNQAQMNQVLIEMLLSSDRPMWQKNALDFAETADIYSMPERAVTLIESLR